MRTRRAYLGRVCHGARGLQRVARHVVHHPEPRVARRVRAQVQPRERRTHQRQHGGAERSRACCREREAGAVVRCVAEGPHDGGARHGAGGALQRVQRLCTPALRHVHVAADHRSRQRVRVNLCGVRPCVRVGACAELITCSSRAGDWYVTSPHPHRGDAPVCTGSPLTSRWVDRQDALLRMATPQPDEAQFLAEYQALLRMAGREILDSDAHLSKTHIPADVPPQSSPTWEERTYAREAAALAANAPQSNIIIPLHLRDPVRALTHRIPHPPRAECARVGSVGRGRCAMGVLAPHEASRQSCVSRSQGPERSRGAHGRGGAGCGCC